jgi:predicted PurR-regulated permease PerM
MNHDSQSKPQGFLVFMSFLTITLWGAVQARTVLIPLCLAALLAFLLAPGVRILRKWKVSELPAVTLVSLLLLLPLVGIAYEAVVQGEALVKEFPQLIVFLSHKMVWITESSFGKSLHLGDYLNVAALSERVTESAGAGVDLFVRSLKALVGAGGHLLIVLGFAVLILLSRRQLRSTLGPILSLSNRSGFLNSVIQLIERFLLVRLGVVLLVGVLDWLILVIFGLKYSLVVATLLGLSTLIPVVGFIIGITPPLIIALSTGFSFLRIGVMVATLFFVSTTEAHLVTPKLLGKHLNLNLLATFVGIFIGEALWGPWGMFLSVPLLGVLRIILESYPEMRPWSNLMAERPLDE